MDTVPVLIPRASINEEMSPSGAKNQSSAFFEGNMFANLNRLATAAGKCVRVSGDGNCRSTDTEMIFQIRELAPERDAIAKCLFDAIFALIFQPNETAHALRRLRRIHQLKNGRISLANR
jgi:hypothetical protein